MGSVVAKWDQVWRRERPCGSSHGGRFLQEIGLWLCLAGRTYIINVLQSFVVGLQQIKFFNTILKMQSSKRAGSSKGENWENNPLGNTSSLTQCWITQTQLNRVIHQLKKIQII